MKKPSLYLLIAVIITALICVSGCTQTNDSIQTTGINHIQKMFAASDTNYEIFPKIIDDWKTQEEVYGTIDKIEGSDHNTALYK